MRKKLLTVCGLLWLFVFVQMIMNFEETKSEDIITAFGNEMYMDTFSSVSGRAYYKSGYISEEEKKQVLKDMARGIGVEEPYEIQEKESENGVEYVLYKKAEKVETHISIATVETQTDDVIICRKHYVLLDMEFENSIESGIYYRDKINSVYESQGMSADVYLYLLGNISGEISDKEKNQIADKILEGVDGENCVRNNGESFICYGYSEGIEGYVTYGSFKTNINIVIRFNKYTNMTEVYMATPILNIDF